MPRYCTIHILIDTKFYVYNIDNTYATHISDLAGQRCVPDKNSENYNSGVTSQWCQDRSDQGYCSNPCKTAEQDLFTREDLLSDTNGLFCSINMKHDFDY